MAKGDPVPLPNTYYKIADAGDVEDYTLVVDTPFLHDGVYNVTTWAPGYNNGVAVNFPSARLLEGFYIYDRWGLIADDLYLLGDRNNALEVWTSDDGINWTHHYEFCAHELDFVTCSPNYQGYTWDYSLGGDYTQLHNNNCSDTGGTFGVHITGMAWHFRHGWPRRGQIRIYDNMASAALLRYTQCLCDWDYNVIREGIDIYTGPDGVAWTQLIPFPPDPSCPMYTPPPCPPPVTSYRDVGRYVGQDGYHYVLVPALGPWQRVVSVALNVSHGWYRHLTLADASDIVGHISEIQPDLSDEYCLKMLRKPTITRTYNPGVGEYYIKLAFPAISAKWFKIRFCGAYFNLYPSSNTWYVSEILGVDTDPNPILKYANSVDKGTTWTIKSADLDPAYNPRSPELDYDTSHNIHVLFANYSEPEDEAYLTHAYYDAGADTWDAAVIGQRLYSPSTNEYVLAVNIDKLSNTLYASYCRTNSFDSTSELMLGTFVGPALTDWDFEVVQTLPTSMFANSVSIVVDTTATMHIIWCQSNKGVGADLSKVNHTYWDGSAWVTEQIEIATIMDEQFDYVSVKLDSAGALHVSYYYIRPTVGLTPGETIVRYATNALGSWALQDVATLAEGAEGSRTIITLNATDQPRLAFYDKIEEKTKYAFFTGAIWSIETVASGTDVGQYCSAVAYER